MRSIVRRKLVRQPACFAKVIGAYHAGFLPELAHDGFAWIFVHVDAALRHLPLKSRKNDFRSVVPKAPPDQHLAGRVEQGDADIGAIGLCVCH